MKSTTIGRRVKYYLIGLGMGLVVTFFIFGNRGCSWLPENRVKTQIESSAIVRTDSMKCILACNDISDDFIYELVKNGEVLFSESQVRNEPKVYVIEYEDIKLHFAIEEDSVVAIVNLNQSKDCNDCKGNLIRPIAMTDKMIKTYLNNREYQIDSKSDCLRKCLNFSNEELFNFLDRAKASESDQSRENKNPTFDFVSGDTLITVERGVRKNRFIRINFPNREQCECP